MEYSSLPYDILYHLCKTVAYHDKVAIRALSLVNKSTRACCIPILFQSIAYKQSLMNNHATPSTAIEELASLQRNVSITRVIRHIHLHLFWDYKHHEEENPTVPVFRAFFDFVFSMELLEELVISIPEVFLEPLKDVWPKYFDGANASTRQLLPALNYLAIPSPSWLFIIEAFPRLRRLLTMGLRHRAECRPFFKDIGRACSQLQEFECHDSPDRGVIDAIADCMPNLMTLGLYGDHVSGGNSWEVDLSPLSRLSRLTTLRLSRSISTHADTNPLRYKISIKLRGENGAIGGPVIRAIEAGVLVVPGISLCRVIFGNGWQVQKKQTIWVNVNGRFVLWNERQA